MFAAVLVAGNVPLMPSPVEEVMPAHSQYPQSTTTPAYNTKHPHISQECINFVAVYSLHTLSGIQHAPLYLPSGAEEEGTMEEEDEESPGGSDVALGQQLTAG